jgi:hypothetical protein
MCPTQHFLYGIPISSGFGTNKFAMTTSDVVAGGLTFGKVETALVSATVNTGFFLSLSFKMYFQVILIRIALLQNLLM